MIMAKVKKHAARGSSVVEFKFSEYPQSCIVYTIDFFKDQIETVFHLPWRKIRMPAIAMADSAIDIAA